MMWRGWVSLSILLLFVLGGCATSRSFSAREAEAPHARCLSEPEPWARGSGDRPLFFLFCIQSP